VAQEAEASQKRAAAEAAAQRAEIEKARAAMTEAQRREADALDAARKHPVVSQPHDPASPIVRGPKPTPAKQPTAPGKKPGLGRDNDDPLAGLE
jgi:hypothetical protein